MVLTGKVSRELVGLINAHGPFAVGLSGEDGACSRPCSANRSLTASPPISLGRDVVSVDASAVEDLINAGRIPVVSSVAPNEDDATEVLNVNADSAAAALAAALGASKLVVLTDVDGLYADWPDRDSLIGRIGVENLRDMLPDLESGMRPKMEAACAPSTEAFRGPYHRRSQTAFHPERDLHHRRHRHHGRARGRY